MARPRPLRCDCLGGEERLEQPRLHFVGHAAAVVGDCDHDVFARRNFAATAEVAARPERISRHGSLDREAAALRHGVARVDREIENDLGELAGIGFDVRAFFQVMQVAFDRNVFAEKAEQGTLEIGDERVHLEHRRLERLAAAEGEELIGEGGSAVGGVADFADVTGDARL